MFQTIHHLQLIETSFSEDCKTKTIFGNFWNSLTFLDLSNSETKIPWHFRPGIFLIFQTFSSDCGNPGV